MRSRVSVIIPVFNDASGLRACLSHLARQTYPREDIEIIVVDNGSTDDVDEAVRGHEVRLVREVAHGSYAARNAGVAVASGDILAFTDSDCCPDADWLVKGLVALAREPSPGFVGGRVSLFYRDERPRTAVELFESTIGCPFPQELLLSKRGFGVTANLLVPRAVFEAVGPFDARLKSAGDRDWGERATAAGHFGIYVPEVTVRHLARHSWRQMWTRSARIAGGVYDLQKARGLLSPRWVIGECLKDVALVAAPVWQFFGWRTAFTPQQQMALWAPMSAVPYVWHHPTLSDLGAKERTLAMAAFVVYHYAQAIERMRLSLGATSRRT